MFELYLQIKKVQAKTFIDERAFSPSNVNIVDIIEDSQEYWNTAESVLRIARRTKGSKLVALLPRGLPKEKAQGKLKDFHLIIQRPFEFSDTVEKIISLL